MIPLPLSDDFRLRRPTSDFAGRLSDALDEVQDIRASIGADDPEWGPLCAVESTLGRVVRKLQGRECEDAAPQPQEAPERVAAE